MHELSALQQVEDRSWPTVHVGHDAYASLICDGASGVMIVREGALLAIGLVGALSMSMCMAALRGRVRAG